MNSKFTNKSVSLVILLAAILVSGSLVYFGTNFFNSNKIKTAVIQGLSEFVQNGPEAYEDDGTKIAPTEDTASNDDIDMEAASDDDPVLGDADAPVTIVEFSDYECPYCGRFFSDTHSLIKEQYIDTGKVKLVFRDFPLDFHAGAMPAAEAANCVREQLGDEGYFEMHDAIFSNQGMLQDPAKGLVEAAGKLGVNMEEFNTCFNGDRYKTEILKDMNDGQSYGITGTPSFLINGQLLVGAQPFSAFQKIIDAELNK